MRITHVNKYYWPPHIGGVETALHDIATGVAARPGYEVRAIVANEAHGTVREMVDGVEVTRLGRVAAFSNTPIVPSLPRVIRTEATRPDPADLLHMHFPYPWGEISWLRASRSGHAGAGLPTVVSYHSDIVRQKKTLAVYTPLLDRFLDRVDVIIASSPNMVEHSPFLAPRAAKCRVVPYGIDVEHFADTPRLLQCAAQLRSTHERPLVLFVGRLVYYKGADVLVRAMVHVDADLVIVGSGPLEGELRELAVAHGVADRITWIPTIDGDALAAWYHAADVLALPSVARSEAFGLVQLEAHASGTPVVTTMLTTSVPFVNADGVTGFNVPVGDDGALASALQRVVGDPELRARLGSQARERARREFTIDRMVDDILVVYEEAIAAHRARATPDTVGSARVSADSTAGARS